MVSRGRVSSVLCLAVVAALIPASASPAARHGRGEVLPVIVQTRGDGAREARRVVAELGGVAGSPLPLVHAFAARVPRAALARLRAAAPVRAVTADARIGSESLSDSCPLLDTVCFDALPPNTVWESAVRLPDVPRKWQGTNVTVALVDTGVTPTPDLGDTYTGGTRVLARVDLTPEHDGIDHYGHGTHMAGLIASNGALSASRFEGAAPEANLVSVKVAGWDGATDVSTVIAGLQWIVANRDRFAIRIVNLSFGTDSLQNPDVDPLDEAVEEVWKAGILVVASAGNRGPLDGTVTDPGNDPYVLTVGAADVNGTTSPTDDLVAPFSSRAAGKPDLLAPGVSLVSTRAPGSTVDTFESAARYADNYFKGTGTSQAAAVVSGIAARVVEAGPGYGPDELKRALVSSANGTLAGTDGAGAGLVDAAAAVAAVSPVRVGDVRVPPTIAPANRSATPSSGLGSLDLSRGSEVLYADLNGDGIPDPLVGDVDALGNPWTPAAEAPGWTPAGWASSVWAQQVSETPGWAPAPPWAGPPTPLLAWDAKYWGATSWLAAAWDAKYWGAKYWGAKYWGSGAWR